MDGQPVDPESAWSGYAGATRAGPPTGAVKRSRERPKASCSTASLAVGLETMSRVMRRDSVIHRLICNRFAVEGLRWFRGLLLLS